MTVAFDDTKTTEEWLAALAPWPGFETRPARTEQSDDNGGLGVDQGDDDSRQEPRHQGAVISEEEVALYVERAIRDMNPSVAMAEYLKSEDGQQFFRKIILKGVKDFGVHKLITDFFASSEGKEYVRQLFMADPVIVRNVNMAVDDRVEQRLGIAEGRSLTDEVEQILADKGVVKRRFNFKSLWLLVIGVAIGIGFNWLVTSMGMSSIDVMLHQGADRLSIKLGSSWLLAGACGLVLVAGGSLFYRFPRSCGRHRR